jgi:hypothetical protein
MANQLRPIVNQRLYFARLHCDWIAQEQERQQLPKRVVEQSLGESVIFHLMLTYKAYLSELGEAYSQPQRCYCSAVELVACLAEQGAESGEAAELAALEQGGESSNWLSDLFTLYQQATNSAQFLPAVAINPVNTIAVEVGQQVDGLSLKNCIYLHDCLSALIENQRLCLEEW